MHAGRVKICLGNDSSPGVPEILAGNPPPLGGVFLLIVCFLFAGFPFMWVFRFCFVVCVFVFWGVRGAKIMGEKIVGDFLRNFQMGVDGTGVRSTPPGKTHTKKDIEKIQKKTEIKILMISLQ